MDDLAGNVLLTKRKTNKSQMGLKRVQKIIGFSMCTTAYKPEEKGEILEMSM